MLSVGKLAAVSYTHLDVYKRQVLLLIGFSVGMSWAMTNADIPYMISDALMGISDNPLIILLLINIVLLIVGIFMDMTPAVLIFTPIFLPIAQELGMDSRCV